ncbi:hypothetical protein L1987_29250 [Smallanthus sonchifolius]|uniref:Uncharacterized protein n=1 Tax=Smallanthus sonchifolius TaxID=185202 RepID=A0ACB9I251_9ASTR|nr:hypothetical protein L1987_29250 [Smallanthus sonchifolius]
MYAITLNKSRDFVSFGLTEIRNIRTILFSSVSRFYMINILHAQLTYHHLEDLLVFFLVTSKPELPPVCSRVGSGFVPYWISLIGPK